MSKLRVGMVCLLEMSNPNHAHHGAVVRLLVERGSTTPFPMWEVRRIDGKTWNWTTRAEVIGHAMEDALTPLDPGIAILYGADT